MNSLLPLIIPLLLGFCLVAQLTRGIRLSERISFALIMAIPVGLGTCSLILFWSYFAGNAHGKTISIFSCIVLLIMLVILLIKNKFYLRREKSLNQPPYQNDPHPTLSPGERENSLRGVRGMEVGTNLLNKVLVNRILIFLSLLIFLIYLWKYWDFFSSRMVWDVFGGWDARFFWNLKAKFYHRIPSEWAQMFSSTISWSHPGYPLMLPGSIAWGWNWLNREILIWPNLVNLSFFAGLVLLTVWYLSRTVSIWCGFLAGALILTMKALTFWSATQYADIPLCFFITASTTTAVIALRHNGKNLFLLSGYLCGLAAWTKDEGLLFSAFLTILIFIAILAAKQTKPVDKLKLLGIFFAGLCLPVLSNLWIKGFLGTTGGEYIGSGRTWQEILKQATNIRNTKIIGMAYWVFINNLSQWKGIWFLFALAILCHPKRAFENHRWIFCSMVLFINLGYFLIFHFTPHGLLEQIKTAMDRLLLHSSILAVIFTFEVFSHNLFSLKQKQSE